MDLRALYESGLEWESWLETQPKAKIKLEERIESYPLTDEDIGFLKGLEHNVCAMAIAEGWCGDVVRQLPILAKMARQTEKLNLRIVGRDDPSDLMERYLTNGAKVIPVFVFFSGDFIEVGNWKGRPKKCRDMIARGKAAGKLDEAKQAVYRLMDETNDRMTVEELKELIRLSQGWD